MFFFHHFIPASILFQCGMFAIRWYGVIIVSAIIIGLGLVIFLAQKRNIKLGDPYDLGFWLLLGGIIGARLYDVFFIEWHYFQNNLVDIFKIWQGGLAIHGAIIGGLSALAIWRRLKKVSFWQLIDLIVPALALGQAIGRWGNYFNQELFGWPTNLPWGIPIEPINRPINFSSFQYFHPAFLYESILNFFLFLILFFMVKSGKYKTGAPLGVYFGGYAIIRFFMEFIRIDETAVVFGWRLPQLVSVLIFFAVLFFFLFKSNFFKRFFVLFDKN